MLTLNNMPKYSKKDTVSDQTKAEAMSIAKGTQKPGQTKEQTKLIAQGIQKGIEQYKKQQKSKARELDKGLKKVRATQESIQAEQAQEQASSLKQTSTGFSLPAVITPWLLLLVSWVGAGAVWLLNP